MTNPDEFNAEAAAHSQRIGHALKDMEARTLKGQRISLTEIMAVHSTPAASMLFEDAPELPARKCGGGEW